MGVFYSLTNPQQKAVAVMELVINKYLGVSINEATKGLVQGLDCIKGSYLIKYLIVNISKFILNTQTQTDKHRMGNLL